MSEQANFDSWALRALGTDQLVNWDALRASESTAPKGLTDAERCGLLLQIANGEALRTAEWNRFLGVEFFPDRRTIAPHPRTRDGIVVVLRALLELESSKVDDIARDAATAASRSVVLVPAWRAGTRVDRVIAASIDGAARYSLWLMLDSDRPFRANLCRCELSTCRRFFLAYHADGDKGRLRRNHCSEDHARDADREKAAKRMQELRRKRR